VKRAVFLALAACGSFEDEDIVVDTRVLAMQATVPDQLVDVDLANPQDPIMLLDQLVPTTMCTLIADPSFDRKLRYTLTLCRFLDSGRCSSVPQVMLAEGLLDDPDITVPEPQLCVTVNPDGNLLGVILKSLEGDVLQGLGGVDYGVGLRVGGDGVDPSLDLFAGKTLRVIPRIPAGRTANKNPSVDHFDAALDGENPMPLPMGRCVDQTAPLVLVPTQRVRLTPIEAPDSREVYIVPTIDGKQEMFTESLTYQWMAGAGGFTSGSTGGPRDISGNPAPLFTDFKAPKAEDLAGVTDIPLWIVQRDERLGAHWYESCVRVVP